MSLQEFSGFCFSANVSSFSLFASNHRIFRAKFELNAMSKLLVEGEFVFETKPGRSWDEPVLQRVGMPEEIPRSLLGLVLLPSMVGQFRSFSLIPHRSHSFCVWGFVS